MGWLRALKYWVAGGRRRWFARKERALPAAALDGAALLEVVEVGLELDAARALAVTVACEARFGAAVASPAHGAIVAGLLARVGRLASGPAWRLGWAIAAHAVEARRSVGRGLALHHALVGELDALVLHLDECRRLEVIDRALLDEIDAALAKHRALHEDARWALCKSWCYEQLGDVWAALRVCRGAEERRLGLIARLERAALDTAAAGDPTTALTELAALREVLAAEREPSQVWRERQGALERHRREILVGVRAELRAALARTPGRAALIECAAFEERVGEWVEAALLLEQAGELADRLRASQLWERDERYGEAVRALGPLSDRAEIQLRTAELREAGGDSAGAAALFEHLKRWADASRAYEAAHRGRDAARCLREADALAAARSTHHAQLLIDGHHVDELVEILIAQLARHPRDRELLARLRGVDVSRIESAELRDAAARLLADGVDLELRHAFDRQLDGWIAQARRETEARYARVWGMDLGTSKSAVAVFDLERSAAVICPHRGQPCFASTLALDKHGNELVGLSALDQLRPDLRGCIEGAKRAMGTRRQYRIGEHQFSPEEVAARLLAHGRGLAEAFLRDHAAQRVLELARAALGDAVDGAWLEPRAARLAFSLPEAVVTIPAYFNFDQRRATRDAAEIAGIKVQRLVPEPTAACLSAGLARQLPGKLMVVDLGAGTLDLSYLEATYLEKNEGFFEVAQIFGDSQFGSRDFDAAIEQRLTDQLAAQGLTLRGVDRRRLHAAAEQLKIALSTSPTARDELLAFAGQDRHTLELSAGELEALIQPLLARLEATCRKATGLAMDHLVLVGGPMFSPLVRGRIEQVLGRKASTVVDPRTAVAMGAACQGALLSNLKQVPFLLLDIVPFALGVLVKQANSDATEISFHIKRGTRIPHENRQPYTTTKDHQDRVDVEVFQGVGDTTDPAASSRLAVVQLDSIAPAKAGEPKIDVTFAIDANGLLEVTAQDTRSGHARSLKLEDATWLSPAQRSEMTQRLTDSQRAAHKRAELAAVIQGLDAVATPLRALEGRDGVQIWQRQFAAWQRDRPTAKREPDDDRLLAEMYNAGQATCDRFQLGLDRARNLRPRRDLLADAVGQLDAGAPPAELDAAITALEAQAKELERELRDVLATLEPIEQQCRRWSAVLTRLGAEHADPRERFALLHDAGDWPRALAAYEQAFAALSPDDVPAPAVHRRLDGLARLGRRDDYRRALATHRDRLALRDLEVDALNEFGRHVSPAITWVFAAERGLGSGFLIAPNLVATNRHVISEPGGAPVSGIIVQVGGVSRTVVRTRLPGNDAVDLAVLELSQPLDVAPVRVGYTGLVEIGERVLAIGFPHPEGSSFEENLLLDHGIVNRIRTRADRHGRELELGLRISAGMSGGPVFNDRGEVIAVSTFVRFMANGPAHDRSSHAIAVDALHELMPRPWA